MIEKSYYYEAHVNVEPILDKDSLNAFKFLCIENSFKPAKFLYVKKEITEAQDADFFCTGRDKEYQRLENSMVNLLRDLKYNGYQVKRYKIEKVVLDSRLEDRLKDIFKLGDNESFLSQAQ